MLCVVLALIYGLDYEIPMGEINGGSQSIRSLALPLLIWVGIGIVALKIWILVPFAAAIEESQSVSLKTIVVSITLVLLFVTAIIAVCINKSA